jgi:predicted O-methyltransferase YrrM
MYNRIQLAYKYLRYYFTASNGRGHGIHSPFVFEFIIKVLNDKTKYDAYKKVEDLRKQLLSDSRILVVEDFGAGSKRLKKSDRSIKSVAQNSAKPAKYGQLLFRMIQYYSPDTVLELGTSLGITTSYLALAKPETKITTMEGAGEIADVASQNFRKLGLENVALIRGNFDDTLPGTIEQLPKIDFAFIDGNHRLAPALHYFQQILGKVNNDTILVFDDIHWSSEMEEAWKIIRAHPSVRCTIDLFFIGIVILRREFQEKQHFTIRF